MCIYICINIATVSKERIHKFVENKVRCMEGLEGKGKMMQSYYNLKR